MGLRLGRGLARRHQRERLGHRRGSPLPTSPPPLPQLPRPHRHRSFLRVPFSRRHGHPQSQPQQLLPLARQPEPLSQPQRDGPHLSIPPFGDPFPPRLFSQRQPPPSSQLKRQLERRILALPCHLSTLPSTRGLRFDLPPLSRSLSCHATRRAPPPFAQSELLCALTEREGRKVGREEPRERIAKVAEIGRASCRERGT